MTEKKVMRLASRGKRFGAACIDAVFPFVAYLIFVSVMAVNGIQPYPPGSGFGNDFGYGYGYGYGYGFGYDYGLDRINGVSAIIIAIVSLLLIAYVVAEFILYAKGKSIGKALLGLQVVSSSNGRPFGFWKMVFRECFVKAASGSVFGLGYIWVLVDEKNRGWHDKILDSYVVDLRESEKMVHINHPVRKENTDVKAEQAAARIPDVQPVEPAAPAEPAAEPVEIMTAETPAAAEPEVSSAVKAETDIEVSEESDPVDVTYAEAEEAVEAEDAEAPKELSMSMKKEELLQAARELGVEVSARATKAAIIEAVEKAKSSEENE